MADAPKSEQTIINDPFKATIAGYKSEIEGYKGIVKSQNDENERLRKHIVLVEYEIDLTKEIVDKKQVEIIRGKNTINDLNEKIVELEDELAKTRVERGAFQKYTDMNNLLLKRIEDARISHEKVEWELSKSIDEVKYFKSQTNDAKLKELMAQDFKSKNEISSLTTANGILIKDRDRLIRLGVDYREEISQLKAKVAELEESIKDTNARNKTREYEALAKSMATDDKFQRVKDDHELVQESLDMSTTHGETLQAHLSMSLEECQEAIQILNASATHSDQQLAAARRREKSLVKEVMTLEAEIELLKKRERYAREELKHHVKKGTGTFGLTAPPLSPSRFTLSDLRPMTGTSGQSTPLDLNSPRDRQPSRPATGNSTGAANRSAPSTPEKSSSPLRRSLSTRSRINTAGTFNTLGDTWRSAPVAAELHESAGKTIVLHRYLKATVDYINSQSPLPATGTCFRTLNLDLSNCQLTDKDFSEVVAWLRLLNTLKYVKQINLRGNFLSNESITASLLPFLVAVQDEEFVCKQDENGQGCDANMGGGEQGDNSLVIDLSGNQISQRGIKDFHIAATRLVKRANVVPLIDLSPTNEALTVFGYVQVQPIDEEELEKAAASSNGVPATAETAEITRLMINNSHFKPAAVFRVKFYNNFGDTVGSNKPFYAVDPAVNLSAVRMLNNNSDVVIDKNNLPDDALLKRLHTPGGGVPTVDATVYPRDSLLRYDPCDASNINVSKYKI
jgi:hypothetical protein